jgi:periplasmic divalent cation tolerance protein
MYPYVVTFITTSGDEESRKIAQALLDKKLAACVNIVPQIESLYVWKGEIESDIESLMIVKTTRDVIPQLIEEVRNNHSYEVFETICLPIAQGYEPYLRWISDVVES